VRAPSAWSSLCPAAACSGTTLAYDLSSLTGGRCYIDVHSSTEVDTVVACGEIS
jgi:hypothetical protein